MPISKTLEIRTQMENATIKDIRDGIYRHRSHSRRRRRLRQRRLRRI